MNPVQPDSSVPSIPETENFETNIDNVESFDSSIEDDARKRSRASDEDEAFETESDDEVEEKVVASGPTFEDFDFPAPVKKAIEKLGFKTPTDIQKQSIPLVLTGKDIVATAETGSGKTAAFSLPILSRMLSKEEPGRALIIAPTRELAEQIAAAIREFTFFTRRFRYAVLIGGSAYGKQLSELRARPYFVVGTPGRINDHLERGTLRLETFDTLVLDEADRLLDMGFEPQIDEIVKLMPTDRQTLLFSATMPPEVKRLVTRYLTEPKRITIGTENKPVDRIKQDVIELQEDEKEEVLLRELDKMSGTAIIFTRTKARADKVARNLNQAGHEADSLHGDLTQGARRRVTNAFRDEKIRFLVATDIAARGLDIKHIEHVINYDLPVMPEDYIHRIGRTARAGKDGHSIAFVNGKERSQWFRILKLMGLPVPPRSEGGFSRDRGGRRNDGKFRGGRGDRNEKGFFSRKRGDDGPRSARPVGGPREDRFARSNDERPSRPRFDRDSAPSERPSRPRFDRSEASERPSRPRFDRSEGPSERPSRPRFDRTERSERSERPRFDRGADREESRAPRGRSERFGGAMDRAERSERPVREERSERPSRPLRQAERFPAPEGPNRAARRAAKFAQLTDEGGRPARAERSERSERSERPRREGGFTKRTGSGAPVRRASERSDRSERPERGSRTFGPIRGGASKSKFKSRDR